ncbi:MBL fold metallo-hydrolase [Parasphaerochaeta coccoides]|uniref:Zn-dependent hydrolase of the beta-lactamase fold-like protein n=1 Tax=Parasphaerochaeta coccoides (strain ATCC BAA-1237 / DSM 17374 / SPN1) TaxID=760011 RepID=F4GI94_PARC1|nr:MBL fold metallo-hydrolase [Parasphaerochaeta coccoides]AEC01253.1 Zn-dependent hydrolase of the beta-lactamase fold-like protein [Parasphaerochaeta coccoides DSM 17374]
MRRIICTQRKEDVKKWLELPFSSQAGTVEFVWLGQAGFIFRTRESSLCIDPYLSNSLWEKYKDAHFTHERMVPIPCEPEYLATVDVIASTHGHTDHMDKGTLEKVYGNHQDSPLYVCPRAEIEKAVARAVPISRIVALAAYETLGFGRPPGHKFSLSAIPSAHETLGKDSYGNDYFLGYIMHFDGMKIYHSGDCIPYEGLEDLLREYGIDVAFLPVNGRDQYRNDHGIPGNFTIDEALTLVKVLEGPLLVPHHFGMFTFNSIEPEAIEQCVESNGIKIGEDVVVPQIGKVYTLSYDKG